MAARKQSSDVEPAEVDGEVNGAVASQQVFRRFLQQMSLTAVMDAKENDSSKIQIQSVEAILSAEDEDEMWDADENGPLNGKKLVDVEQEVTGFTVKYSRDPEMNTIFITEDGKRLYLMVEATRLDTAEQIIWNTSAPLLVAKIWWLNQREKFPYASVIRSSDLGGGKAVLKLKRVPVRPERVI